MRQRGLRAFWIQVHLWLGLTLGGVGVLVGLSGSILVYDHEIDALLNSHRYAISGSQVGRPYAEYAQRAQQALEGKPRATGIRLPDRDPGPVIVFARADSGPFQRVYLDPPTGRVLATASGRDWLGWLHGFHESLALREWNGREIVGVVGIGMLISSLTGIYLWWPAGRMRLRALGFRRGFALHRNLHYTFGIGGALVLAVVSFSGLFLAYQDAGRAVVATFGTVSPSPRAFQSATGSGDTIAPDEIVAIAQQRVANAVVTAIGLPAGPRGVYRVNLREYGDTAARSTTVVFIDPRSQAILHAVDQATRGGGDAFLVWQRMLHEGSAFGSVWRFLTFLGGMLPALLLVTGLIMWQRKRQQRVRGVFARVAAGAGR